MAGILLKDAAMVDARHLVRVFHVDYTSFSRHEVPRQLTKYSDTEGHAPYHSDCLKLATLRHYREQHQNLEGTGDSMEGRIQITSTLEEMCRRHGSKYVPHGAHFVRTNATYQTDDTSLIYCTSLARYSTPLPKQWKIKSRIRNVPKLALFLGVEFARQCDEGRCTAVTTLDSLLAQLSKWDSIVYVLHGAVVYDDTAGQTLFTRIPEHTRGLAAHFFKRTEFQNQQEYRFVLSAQGKRPAEDEFYLNSTPELRSVFQKP